MEQNENLPDETDPTVLEYARRWIGEQLKLQQAPPVPRDLPSVSDSARTVGAVFWAGLALLFLGQFLLGIERQSIPTAGIVVIIAGLVCVWFGAAAGSPDGAVRSHLHGTHFNLRFKPVWMAASLVMAAVGFLSFTENRFGWLQTLSWLTASLCSLYTFWPEHDDQPHRTLPDAKSWHLWRGDRLFLCIVLAVAACGLVFRLKGLKILPPEVISAQVETFVSVSAIPQGGNYVLFSRNAVPEPLNYYWPYLTNLFSGNALSMSGLRLANSVAGLVGLVFMYGLGKKLANRWVGMAAAALAGGSYWLVLQERATIGGGLVFPLMAAAVYALIKGFDEQDGRYYLLSSAAFGLGLMSNKIFLIFPLVVVSAWLALRSQHRQVNARSWAGLLGAGLLVFLTVAMPLLRAISLEPASYFAPVLARIGQTEVAYAGSPILIFLGNVIKSLGMVNWSSQGSWADSIANRAAVDGLTGVFFLFGFVRMAQHFQKRKDWKLLAMLLLYPILLLPSALALAFPAENPSMARAVGAAVPVMIIASWGMIDLVRILSRVFRQQARLVRAGLAVLLLAPVLISNYQLVFTEYADQYKRSAWNASEMADVIQRFFSSGREGISYLVSYPYWVDSRAVSISMGRQEYNLSLSEAQIESTANVTLPKLFIVNPMDKQSIALLQATYPQGVISTYQSVIPDKNFVIYIVDQ